MEMEFLDLGDLLGAVANDIVEQYGFDGYSIALWDDAERVLSNRLAHLPPRLHEMEAAYASFRFQPNDSTVAGLAFSNGKTVVLGRQSVNGYSATIQDVYARWGFSTFAAWPIRVRHPDGEHIIGVFSAFLELGGVSQEEIEGVERKLLASAASIAASLEQETVELVDPEDAGQFAMLQALIESNRAGSLAEAVVPFFDFVMQRFGFDLAALALADDGGISVSQSRFTHGYEHLQASWLPPGGLRYAQDVGDGLTAVSYLQNTHFLVEDVQQIAATTFPAKDIAWIRALQTVRSYLVLPMRLAGQPIGVLWLVSLGQPVHLDQRDLDLPQLLADFLATVVARDR